MFCVLFLFFKQKTAYEMRISDWSSDVCSSDLLDMRVMNKRQLENLARAGAFDSLNPNRQQVFQSVEFLIRHASAAQNERESRQIGRASCRERVCQYV